MSDEEEIREICERIFIILRDTNLSATEIYGILDTVKFVTYEQTLEETGKSD